MSHHPSLLTHQVAAFAGGYLLTERLYPSISVIQHTKSNIIFHILSVLSASAFPHFPGNHEQRKLPSTTLPTLDSTSLSSTHSITLYRESRPLNMNTYILATYPPHNTQGLLSSCCTNHPGFDSRIKSINTGTSRFSFRPHSETVDHIVISLSICKITLVN
ncbi:hypothetical protein ABKN59_002096 [Abortiporus biennis]